MIARRPLPAATVYLLIQGLGSASFATAFTLSAIYRSRSAGLDPFQLILLGTALEAAAFLFEVPTGVVADAVSRRLSVIVGYGLIGAGIVLEGSFPLFGTILVAQVIWGIGSTFTSGAEAAWLADEIGEDAAARLYLRGAQAGQAGAFFGILLCVALGSVRLNLPFLVGGAGFIALAAILWRSMPEAGFTPVPRAERETWAALGGTFRGGLTEARRSPRIGTIFLIAAIAGAASEAYDRLWEVRVLQVGLPDAGDLDPLVWFGVINIGGLVLSIATTEVVRRRALPEREAVVVRWLVWIKAGLVLAVAAVAVAPSFASAMVAVWAVTILRGLNGPLSMAWLNRGLPSRNRATILSMYGQADALGQIGGGPVLGAVGARSGIPAALAGAALFLSPAIWLTHRAREGPETATLTAAEPAPPSPADAVTPVVAGRGGETPDDHPGP
ncbi:MAG: MFS transporter [Chloroflexota bacterium]|nr:MFS transporter [Chloroflexota bacterium]